MFPFTFKKKFLVFGLDTPDYDIPSKEHVSQETRRKWLHELCLQHVETFLMPSQEVDPLVQQVHELESAMTGGFRCRVEECDKRYVRHSTRVKYVKSIIKFFNNFFFPYFKVHN